MMKALIKRPKEKPEWIEIENELEALQKAVGGYIQAVTFNGFVVICDEEGWLKGQTPNCNINGVPFVGTILIVGDGGDEFTDLPEIVAYLMEVRDDGHNRH